MIKNTMRTAARGLTVVALAAALAACSAETVTEVGGPGTLPAADDPAAETAEAPSDGPAGEVAPDSREAADPATEEVAEAASEVAEAAQDEAKELPGGLDPKKWGVYWKHIDFRFGSEAGLAEAAESGKPMMIFYTATW